MDLEHRLTCVVCPGYLLLTVQLDVTQLHRRPWGAFAYHCLVANFEDRACAPFTVRDGLRVRSLWVSPLCDRGLVPRRLGGGPDEGMLGGVGWRRADVNDTVDILPV